MKKLLFLLSMTVLGNLQGAEYQSASLRRDHCIIIKNKTGQVINVNAVTESVHAKENKINPKTDFNLCFPREPELLAIRFKNGENNKVVTPQDLDWENNKESGTFTITINPAKDGKGWEIEYK